MRMIVEKIKSLGADDVRSQLYFFFVSFAIFQSPISTSCFPNMPSDCVGNRAHQSRLHRPVRKARVLSVKTTQAVLYEWKRRLSSETVADSAAATACFRIMHGREPSCRLNASQTASAIVHTHMSHTKSCQIKKLHLFASRENTCTNENKCTRNKSLFRLEFKIRPASIYNHTIAHLKCQ